MCCISAFILFSIFKIKAFEAINIPTVALGGSACTALADFDAVFADEPIVVFLEFFGGREVAVASSGNGCADAFFNQINDFEREIEAAFLDHHFVAALNLTARFDLGTVHFNFTRLDGIGCQCPRFEDADTPKPFVDSYFFCHFEC